MAEGTRVSVGRDSTDPHRPHGEAPVGGRHCTDSVKGSPCGQGTDHERRGRQRGPSREQQNVPWGPETPSANLPRPSCPHSTHFFLFLSILGVPLRHAPADSNSHPSAWALPSQGLTISCTGVSALLSLCAQHCPSPVPFPVPSALWPLCPGPSWGFRGPSFLCLPSEHGSPRLCHHSGPLCSRRPSQVHSGLSLFR